MVKKTKCNPIFPLQKGLPISKHLYTQVCCVWPKSGGSWPTIATIQIECDGIVRRSKLPLNSLSQRDGHCRQKLLIRNVADPKAAAATVLEGGRIQRGDEGDLACCRLCWHSTSPVSRCRLPFHRPLINYTARCANSSFFNRS